MVDITYLLIKYRNCIRELWNNYFIERLSENDNFEAYLDMYYNLISESLFVSLVTSRAFDREIVPTEQEYYNEIQIQPELGPKGYRAMCANPEDENYEWDYVWIQTDKNTFNFMAFYDWTDVPVKDCQYTKVKLTKSEEFPEFIGYEFLFDAANVIYIAIK